VELDVAALTLLEVPQLAFRGLERISHRGSNVGRRVMLLCVIGVMADHKLLPRHDQHDMNVENVTGSMLMMLQGDGNSAVHEPLVHSLELCDSFANVGFDRRGSVDIAEADLKGFLHTTSNF
jgi:hypothetical protein